MRRKSELITVRSVDAVANIAPDASKFGDSFSTLFRSVSTKKNFLTFYSTNYLNNDRWKRSIYKLVWRHMVGYYIVYVSLTLIYTFLNEESKKYLLF